VNFINHLSNIVDKYKLPNYNETKVANEVPYYQIYQIPTSKLQWDQYKLSSQQNKYNFNGGYVGVTIGISSEQYYCRWHES
jgi:hypothetical protein